jgi:membrane protease subunit HflK
MFDGFITFVLSIWEELNPFFIVNDYEEGVLLLNGKYQKTLKPGLHMKVPLAGNYLKTNIVATTYDLQPQSLTTADNKTVTVRGMVKSKVTDVKKFLLEAYDQADVLGDITMGEIAKLIQRTPYDQLSSDSINNEITKKARAKAKAYGIEVLEVTLVDNALAPAFRIISGNPGELSILK